MANQFQDLSTPRPFVNSISCWSVPKVCAMFSRSCLCVPGSFTAPLDGDERDFSSVQVKSHDAWCPEAQIAPPSHEKLPSRNPVSSKLKQFTRDELESLIQEQLQRRIRENHRANQLKHQIDQTEAILERYRHRLDALKKHVDDLSLVTNNCTSLPDKPPKKLARNVGLQAKVKPTLKEESGEPLTLKSVRMPENVGRAVCQTLDNLELALSSPKCVSIGEDLERNLSPENINTQKIKPCSVALTRCPELDACAQQIKNNDYANLVEVDLTLSDEEGTANSTPQTTGNLVSQSAIKRRYEVNERALTDHVDKEGLTNLKRIKACCDSLTEELTAKATPEALPKATVHNFVPGKADETTFSLRPTTGAGTGCSGAQSSETAFQPRVPVIISVTSITTPPINTWSSRMAPCRPRATHHVGPSSLYHHWKMPANPGLVAPSVDHPAKKLKAGVLLDLSTKNERKPVVITQRPQRSAQDRLPILVNPKVIVEQVKSPIPPVAPLYPSVGEAQSEKQHVSHFPQKQATAQCTNSNQVLSVLDQKLPDNSYNSNFQRAVPVQFFNNQGLALPPIRPQFYYNHPRPSFAAPNAVQSMRSAPQLIDIFPLRLQFPRCAAPTNNHKEFIKDNQLPNVQPSVLQQSKPVKRAIPGLMPINNTLIKTHPAPLPNQSNTEQFMSKIFKPNITITPAQDGIELRWAIPNLAKNQLDEITHYELYSYQESPVTPSSELWKQVGCIRALTLPMGCTLSKFAKGFRYHFAIRAILRHGSAHKANGGPFSDFASILYE